MEAFLSFYKNCRLCLDKPGSTNIFENDDFTQDIFLFTSVKVHPSDNLPQKICGTCYNIIQKAKTLRTIATKNNIHLRTLFDIQDQSPSTSVAIFSDTEDTLSSTNKTSNEWSHKNETSPQTSKISVRKDLTHSSSAVSSSTTNKKTKNQEVITDDITTCKQITLDNGTVLFECSICFKTYDKWKKLYLHQRHHNKSIICPVKLCGKKFTMKGDLDKHYRTHTGEKPYQCDSCDKSFTQKVSLKLHKESLHNNAD